MMRDQFLLRPSVSRAHPALGTSFTHKHGELHRRHRLLQIRHEVPRIESLEPAQQRQRTDMLKRGTSLRRTRLMIPVPAVRLANSAEWIAFPALLRMYFDQMPSSRL